MFLVLKLQHWKKKEYLFSLRGKKNNKVGKKYWIKTPQKKCTEDLWFEWFHFYASCTHVASEGLPCSSDVSVSVFFLHFFSVRRVSLGMCVCILSNANDKIYYLFNSIRWSIRFIFCLFFCFLYSLTHHLFLSAFKMCVRIAHVLELECNKAC